MGKTFTEAKNEFDKQYSKVTDFVCFLPNHLKINAKSSIKKKDGSKNEQYYKWQFLYSIVYSGLFSKDYIGTEIHFPKGNKNSADIIIDAAVFSEESWFDKYKDYHQNGNPESLGWLRKHLVVALEFKKEDNKNISEVWDKQLKAYLKESESEFCLGVLYDTERLYLFRKYNNKYLRYSEDYNTKGEESGYKEMSLHLPDPYRNIPSFDKVINWTVAKRVDLSKRCIGDLDIISGIQSTQINNAMSAILRRMDKLSMFDQKGFEILVQILSLKIFDEKRNEKQPGRFLDFYIQHDEKEYKTLADKEIQSFIQRINGLIKDASGNEYVWIESVKYEEY